MILTAAMYGYALVRGRARISHEPRRVLVVQMAKLGDMVCTTPVFHALRQALPQAHITVMGSRINKDVLEGNKDVDAYIVFSGIRSALHELHREDFDIAVLAGGPDLTTLAVAFLSGVPCIIAPKVEGGYSPLYDMWYRLASILVFTVPHRMKRYAPREYLRLLEPMGITASDTIKHLSYSAAGSARADEFMEGVPHPLIGISPGAGNKIKEWSAERFAIVADSLAQTHGATIVILGGARDKEEVRALRAHLSDTTPRIDLAERLSIDELKAVISRLDLFIAVDTGPIYIAEAFGVPTVDITGPIDEHEQPPIGPRHVVVTPPEPREPQLFVLNSKSYNAPEARRQAMSITTKAVLHACAALLSK